MAVFSVILYKRCALMRSEAVPAKQLPTDWTST